MLEGKTRGYKNHPQLIRFKTHPEPLKAISFYLYEVYQEARSRGYNFDLSKVHHDGNTQTIPATSGQLDFEIRHLLKKLEKRSKKDYDFLIALENVAPHPLFEIGKGNIEDWEKGSKSAD
ncbi:MAG: hypothetical protein JEZ06_18920 [Anaerolineaceae bacterium]|nr:hypothetical protein [Anaerolineaceae bacterium]